MAGLYDGIEEMPFKQVAGGYVFQTNNRWLIGPRRRYFVNEAQKIQIAACIRETMRRIKPFAFSVAALFPVVLIAAISWLILHGSTANTTMIAALLLMAGLFVPYFAAIHIYSMRRLEPLLAGLPRSNERITLREGSQAFASKASFKLLLALAIGSGLGFLGNGLTVLGAWLENRPLAHPQMTFSNMGLSALVSAYFIYLLILKTKAKKSAG